MKATTRQLLFLLLSASVAFAQEESDPRPVELPNPMGAHTWFIMVAVGVFLAWCISYCLQVQKESLRRKPSRDQFLRQKEQLLDQLAKLEFQKDAGTIPTDKFDREFRKAKSRLSQVLAQLARDQKSSVER